MGMIYQLDWNSSPACNNWRKVHNSNTAQESGFTLGSHWTMAFSKKILVAKYKSCMVSRQRRIQNFKAGI